MLRIFLNGNLVEYGVLGLDQITEDLELKRELYGYLYQVQGSITFVQDDYDYLRALFESGYCEDVDIDIQHSSDFGNSWISKVKALVKLAGVKWDRIKRLADCPIVDNSFQSKINNNRNIEFTLGNYNGVVLSKNGVDVSDRAVYHSDVQMFSPFRGRNFSSEAAYFKSNPPFPAGEGNDLVDFGIPGRSGIFIWDAMNLLIGLMTDGEVDFTSDYLSYSLISPLDSNEDAFAMLFSGQSLKYGSLYPTISFDQLFGDLHKLSNLWFTIETGVTGKPVFRVENEDYFRQSNSGVYFDSVTSFIEAIDLGKVYSKVVLGCSQSSGDFPVGEIKLIQHMQEEFPLSGTCNVDSSLDLRLQKLIINTNSIASVLPSISGFSAGSLVQRKFTTGQTTAGPNQKLTDSSIDFKESLVEPGFLITNTISGEWSYITGVPDSSNILIYDEIFQVDNTGETKNYEIYKPSDSDNLLDQVFLIQIWRELYDGFGILQAKPTEIDPPGDLWYYNEVFSNANVITRHMGGVSQSIVNSLTDGNDQFLASQTTAAALNDTNYFQTVVNAQYRRIRFNDDVNLPYFDTNGNYDALTGIYTAPSPGYYHAYCSVKFINDHVGTEDFVQQVEMSRVSASGDVIQTESALTTISSGANFTFTMDRVFYLDEGETVQVFVKKPFGTTGLYLNQFIPFSEFDGPGSFGEGYGVFNGVDTFFGVDELINGGGEVPASEPADVRLLNFETELSVSRSVFDNVLANPFKYYHTNLAPMGQNPMYQTGYIGKISRGILNGDCTMTQFKKHDGV